MSRHNIGYDFINDVAQTNRLIITRKLRISSIWDEGEKSFIYLP